MVAVLTAQRAEFPLRSRAYLVFWIAAYQAIDD